MIKKTISILSTKGAVMSYVPPNYTDVYPNHTLSHTKDIILSSTRASRLKILLLLSPHKTHSVACNMSHQMTLSPSRSHFFCQLRRSWSHLLFSPLFGIVQPFLEQNKFYHIHWMNSNLNFH